MTTITGNKVLVDLPIFTRITGNEKIIFSKNEPTSLLFKIKKFFMQKRMQEVAAVRIKNLFDTYARTDIRYKNLVAGIDVTQGVDESKIIDTFEDIINKNRLNKLSYTNKFITKIPDSLPNEIEELITHEINNPNPSKLRQDLIDFSKQKISMLIPAQEIEIYLTKFENKFPNNLSELKLKDFQKINTIFFQVLKLLPKSDDPYINELRKHINDRLEIVRLYCEKLEQSLQS